MIVSEIVDAIQTGNEGPGAFVKWVSLMHDDYDDSNHSH